MKYKLLTAALLVVLPVLITGCSLQDLPVVGKFFNKGGPSTSGKEVTITVWGLWENPEVLDVLSAKYKETHPNVTISYDDRSIMKPDQFRDTVATRLSQGGSFDIVLLHNTWVKYLKDYLEPVPESVISTDDYSKTYYPIAKNSAVFDNKPYALPAFFDGLAVVYNKKHFAAINQVSPPTAWEEFRSLAQNLTKRDKDGNLVQAGAAIGAADNIEFASDILGLMFSQANLSLPGDLDSVEAQDTLTFYTNFVKEDGVWSTSFPEAATAFSRGQVSMIFVPSWNLLDVVRETKDKDYIDIGVAPVPQVDPAKPVNWGSFWMYAVPKSSSNKEAAWEFLKFLMADEQQLQLFGEASKYRAFGAPFASVNLKKQISDSPDLSKYLKAYIDSADTAVSNPLVARAGDTYAADPIRQAISAVLKDQRNGGMNVKDALATAKNMILTAKPWGAAASQ